MSAISALEPAPGQPADEVTAGQGGKQSDDGGQQIEQKVAKEAKEEREEGSKEEIEQKETQVVKEESKSEDQSTLTPALSQREREVTVARIRESASLPPVLKERLAALVEASGETVGDGKVRVSIDEAILAVEEALPDFLRMDKQGAKLPEHPAGNAFFSGDASEISDAQAEELARGQLARSGLLRGQRVRMAE